MKMHIMKFGGTSVMSPANISKVISIVSSRLKTTRVAVVVSAFGGVTDLLIAMSRKAAAGEKGYMEELRATERRHLDAVRRLIPVRRQSAVLANVKLLLNELEDVLHGVSLVRELTAKTQDFILSFGERLSAYIISESFSAAGVAASCADGARLIRTDGDFGRARVDFRVTDRNIRSHFRSCKGLQVFPGFIGSTALDEVTTLGRGGSDYTAAIVASAVRAAELEIWTDVDGIMTADPRKVARAFPVKSLSYEETMELSHFGAKVIYPPTVQPVMDKGIPIRIRNTFNPEAEGTLIGPKGGEAEAGIRGISSIDDIALMTLRGSGLVGVAGIAMRLFGALARSRISVIMISQASSEHSINFAVAPADVAEARKAIGDEFRYEIMAAQVEPVTAEEGLSIVAAVGGNMRRIPGIAGRLFSALGRNGVNIVAIAQGSSELNISLAIPKRDLKKALNVIHEAFFLSDVKALNLFLAGTGTVGGTLLKQIAGQREYLLEHHNIDLRIIGLTNTRKTLFDAGGIDATAWEKRLASSKSRMSIADFAAGVIATNIRNSIFVDCTSSAEVAAQYERLLDASISVVTPNKIACSGSLKRYRELRRIAVLRGVKFLYETNVGAGLPVLSTLGDLIRSGDRVNRIEAVLSGTLNFIFNTHSKAVPFSRTVRLAMEKGFAEPDPRIDLNGVDVARKILILAREAGALLESKDVHVENFLPAACRRAKTMNDFWKALEAADDDFERDRAALGAAGKKRRYVAVYSKGKASISLREYDSSHPFYFIEGSDNIILFTTDRYREQPLIIKGAGAGAAVTAAGVLADVVRVGS